MNDQLKSKLTEKKNSDGKIQLVYEVDVNDFTKEELEVFLSLISVSKFEGSKIQTIFNLSTKIQYKIKLLEETK